MTIMPQECGSYKELLRHFFAQALFCTFGKLGKLCFFWCYCDPRYVTFKLTLEGFKIIKASFWIRKKLLCTSFESDFQRSSYVTTCHKAHFAGVCAACRWSPAHQGSCIGPMEQSHLLDLAWKVSLSSLCRIKHSKLIRKEALTSKMHQMVT